MAIESDGHSRGNPRIYELVEHTPKTGKSPTVWSFPQVMDWFKVAGQPVPGPWPPHQEARPEPEEESVPVAVAEPEPQPESRSQSERTTSRAEQQEQQGPQKQQESSSREGLHPESSLRGI